jgi:fructose-specific phosphotransferase system IIC component
MFKLKTGVSEFELLQTVMKAAFGVSVARKHPFAAKKIFL